MHVIHRQGCLPTVLICTNAFRREIVKPEEVAGGITAETTRFRGLSSRRSWRPLPPASRRRDQSSTTSRASHASCSRACCTPFPPPSPPTMSGHQHQHLRSDRQHRRGNELRDEALQRAARRREPGRVSLPVQPHVRTLRIFTGHCTDNEIAVPSEVLPAARDQLLGPVKTHSAPCPPPSQERIRPQVKAQQDARGRV